MTKFLSNDRKVILKSAAVGTALIATLSCALYIENILIWSLAFLNLIAIYWYIPTWFSRNRQLVIKENKYLNGDGEEVILWSPREKMGCFIISIIINLTLFFVLFVYNGPIQVLTDYYPNNENLIIYITVILFFAAPYLLRHICCFIKNLPMDTSFKFSNITYKKSSYNFKSSSSWSANELITNPRYSSLACNIYNHKK